MQKSADVVMEKKKEKWIRWGCLVIAFLIYFSISCLLPVKKAPDEPLRYKVSEFIYTHHHLPVGTDILIRSPEWGFSYAFTPYLPSAVAAGIMKLVSLFGNTEEALLIIASRFVNVLAAAGSLFVAFKVGKRLFPKGASGFLFAVCVGFLPQFVFLAGYLNNDVVSVFAAMLILYGWLYGKERHWDIKSCLFLAGGLSICILTYYNAYGWVLCSVIYFLGSIWLDNTIEQKWKHILSRGSMILVPVFLLTGWFFIRNAILYDGDFLAMRTLNACGELYGYGPYKPSNRNLYSLAGLSVVDMLRQTDWIESTIKSFFAVFGYMDIKVPGIFYKIYLVLVLTGGVGFVYGICKKKAKAESLLLYGCCLLCMIIPTGLSIYYSYATDYQAQGRYLMSALPALALLVSTGYNWLDEAGGKKKGYAVASAIAIWLLLFVTIFVTVMIPELYKGVLACS